MRTQNALSGPLLSESHTEPSANGRPVDDGDQRPDEAVSCALPWANNLLRPAVGGVGHLGLRMLLAMPSGPEDLALFLAGEAVPGATGRHNPWVGPVPSTRVVQLASFRRAWPATRTSTSDR